MFINRVKKTPRTFIDNSIRLKLTFYLDSLKYTMSYFKD